MTMLKGSGILLDGPLARNDARKAMPDGDIPIPVASVAHGQHLRTRWARSLLFHHAKEARQFH